MSRKEFQEALDRTVEMETELRTIENQIQELETAYLERTWLEGNVLIGWNNISSFSHSHNNNIRIKLTPKDRAFSISSVTSRSYRQLQENVDRQVNALVEMRFSNSIKKKYRKKKKRTRASLVTRNRRFL